MTNETIKRLPRPCTEAGNAERLADQCGDMFRYCEPLGGWFHWDGCRWSPGADALKAACLNVVRGIGWEAAAVEGALHTQLLKHQISSEKNSSLNGMISIGASIEPFPVKPSAFDSDPWALNCKNGVLDLRTGALTPHDARSLHTKLAPVTFDASAVAPRWDRFIERILPNEDVRSFVQRFSGYALSGAVRERVLVILIGEGRNGKSVFVRVLRHLLGDYATYAAPEVLLSKDGDRHPTELADLVGIRLAAMSEVKAGRSFDESTLKRLTGNEPLKARRMRQDFFEFEMRSKLVLATNHLPKVNDDTQSIWDRIRSVPFTVRIPDDEVDTSLYETLVETELPGILNWALRGCAAWQQDGLGTAAVIEAATEAYRGESDDIQRFLNERYVRAEGGRITRADLLLDYQAWCQANGRGGAVSAKSFAAEIRNRGVSEGRAAADRFWKLAGRPLVTDDT